MVVMPIATFQHPALSLWQSAVHRVVGDGGGLHTSADHPAMTATVSAGREIHGAEGDLEATASTMGAAASLYARLAIAKFEGDDALVRKIQDEIHFSVCDPLWAEILIQFEKSLLADDFDPYIRHASLDDFILPPLPADATVALVADWATGSASARAVLEQIATFLPDVVVHLGDVYFSCLPEEGRTHFTDVFEAVFGDRMPRVVSLAGNHDRYSGGRGYLDLIGRLGQPASYFCLRNDAWQLLAMDTGYHDRDPRRRRSNVTTIEQSELEWHRDKLRRAGEGVARPRGTVLLSHHQLFSWISVGKGEDGRPLAVNPLLHAAFAPALGDVDLWFWGHEHNLGLFAPYAGLARGRGIGSGAIPVLVPQRPYDPAPDLVIPDGESGPPAPLPGTELGHNGVVYNHAFAILRLEGPRATVRYYQTDATGAEPGKAPPLGPPFFTETIDRG
jgi:hypothetical protein